jgi:DNA-directed RNA polymerase specialized sigma24 family protein
VKQLQSLVDPIDTRKVRKFWGSGVQDRRQNLPQLYRFCFLMLGDSRKAQEVFHGTLREAAQRAAHGELPQEPFWLFRQARWRCLELDKDELQPEPLKLDEHDLTPHAASQIERLDATQLAVWISAAPEPQRTAMALFYLNEFDHYEILDIAELKISELSRCLAQGRRELQAWLDAKFPDKSTV